tara:strand:- start:237 stop:485 length:249 start_codon:yes stop_codon:yes gene_type:complete
MGFHKRHIDNQQVINLYKSGGVENVTKWFTGKVDALILETGLASNINSILCDSDWQVFGSVKINEEIVSLINKELGIEEFRT